MSDESSLNAANEYERAARAKASNKAPRESCRKIDAADLAPVPDVDAPAFPDVSYRDGGMCDQEPYHRPGMTLHDYFAAQALSGLGSLQLPYEEAASVAYKYADAMLRERAKRG